MLFSHSSRDEGVERLHDELRRCFESKGLALQRNPFAPGEDVDVAMDRLQVHAVVLYCTPNSLASVAVGREVAAARRAYAAIAVVRAIDGPLPPADLRNRIYCTLDDAPTLRQASMQTLANALAERARVHWAIRWLRSDQRDVIEREVGTEWMSTRDAQVLAEFLEPIARLHRQDRESPTVGYWLARILGKTGHPDAVGHLETWRRIAMTADTWGAGHPRHLRVLAEEISRLLPSGSS